MHKRVTTRLAAEFLIAIINNNRITFQYAGKKTMYLKKLGF